MYTNMVAAFVVVVFVIFLKVMMSHEKALFNTWMDFICLKCSAKALPPSPTNFICHGNKIDNSSQLSCFLSHYYKKNGGGEYIATCV